MAAILGALAPCKITEVGVFGSGGGSEAPCKSLLASLDVFWRGLTTLLGAPPCNPMCAPLGHLLARSGGTSGISGAFLGEVWRLSGASRPGAFSRRELPALLGLPVLSGGTSRGKVAFSRRPAFASQYERFWGRLLMKFDGVPGRPALQTNVCASGAPLSTSRSANQYGCL